MHYRAAISRGSNSSVLISASLFSFLLFLTPMGFKHYLSVTSWVLRLLNYRPTRVWIKKKDGNKLFSSWLVQRELVLIFFTFWVNSRVSSRKGKSFRENSQVNFHTLPVTLFKGISKSGFVARTNSCFGFKLFLFYCFKCFQFWPTLAQRLHIAHY